MYQSLQNKIFDYITGVLLRLPEGAQLPTPRRFLLGFRCGRRGRQRLDVADRLRGQVLRPGQITHTHRREGPQDVSKVDRQTTTRERLLPRCWTSLPQGHEGNESVADKNIKVITFIVVYLNLYSYGDDPTLWSWIFMKLSR